MEVINLTILYLSRYAVTFASVTTVTIVMSATSLGILSENELDNFITTFHSLEFQLGSVSWYQEGTLALPPGHPTTAGFHQATVYPLVNQAPSFWTSSLNTTKAVESLLIPTAPEQLQQPTTLSRYSSLYSCLQLHYTLLATYLILGFQPLTLLPFLSLIIKKHC